MFASLPHTAQEVMGWDWSQFEPYYQELAARPLTANNVKVWLADWTRINELVSEVGERLAVATTVNTADAEAEQRYKNYLDAIFPAMETAEQTLKRRLIESNLEPEGFEVPLRNMRAEADLFRDATLPLLTQERKLGLEYDQIVGAQTITWDGKELALAQAMPHYMTTDRSVRENIWRLIQQRVGADRAVFDALWARFIDVRQQIAASAGLPDYRTYRWRQLLRFDYTPDDCKHFHEAIEEAVVPAFRRILENYRQRLGVDTLRPWDVYWFGLPISLPALKPFSDVETLETTVGSMFQNLEPQLAAYFDTMRREGLLDLASRKNKGPGGYCTSFSAAHKPFIFMNTGGLHSDVVTLLHESGHAFHAFESSRLPYYQQRHMPMEFAEVASMSMELLAGPYLSVPQGGFYSEQDTARARVEHLQYQIGFWPYMALVDAFQHWIYENPGVARDAHRCDEKWAELYRRFIPIIDWTGIEENLTLSWRRQLHIFQLPFYYVEYGLAQLGAVQVWANVLKDRAGALAAYRKALALGSTVPLPQLYKAAGARLAFDADTLREAVDLCENTLNSLRIAQ